MLLRSFSTPRLCMHTRIHLSHHEILSEAQLDSGSHVACRGLNRGWSSSNSLRNLAIHGLDVQSQVGPLGIKAAAHDCRSRLRRARSEPDLAILSGGFTLINSLCEDCERSNNVGSYHRQWSRRLRHMGSFNNSFSEFEVANSNSIQEEISENILEEESEPDHGSLVYEIAEASTSGREVERFLMEDGETYTSLGIGGNGLPVVCNSRGCRPLTESELRLIPMSMASGLGSGIKGGCSARNNNSSGRHATDFERIEAYYEMLLSEDFQNPLVLRNFAQFLYEVKRDVKKAEEFYERAILAAPSDGDVSSSYARLIWDVYRDQNRANSYYDRALQVAPDNSFVLASYASFLWDSEESEQMKPSYFDTKERMHPSLQERAPLLASA